GQSSKSEQLSELQLRIDRARAKIGSKRGTERVLSSDITRYSRRIDRLRGKIGTLSARQRRIEVELELDRAELERLRSSLRRARARLVRLRKRVTETGTALSDRLVEIYKAPKPDVVTVILNSDGFADLIERGEFIKRISDQDRKIVAFARNAKADAIRAERRLDGLERRQQNVTAIAQKRRDDVSAIRMELVGTRVGYARTKAGKASALRRVRGQSAQLESNLDELEAASRRVAGELRAAQRRNNASAPDAGPIKRGSGRLIFPVNGPITSPFGPRWGRLHAGIDIPAPDGTPIRSADAGTVVLLQGVGASGGYGNYTCVQHTATMSTCYAHQSRLATSPGAQVEQGQVIGYVGNTGNSFGAHLHFEVRVNGTPVDPMGYL
ncbi:MAG: murein hydrolase activator EnvC family protein, partial [Solirubrobacteraceae bacterium]